MIPKFYTDDKLRKLFVVLDALNTLGFSTEQVDRRLFPPAVYYIYQEIRCTPAFWKKVIEGYGDGQISYLLNMVNIPLEHNDELFKKMEEKITSEINEYWKQAGVWIKKIFGFELPDTLNILLDITERNGRHGLFISTNPPTIAIQVDKNDNLKNRFITPILHETLHVLLNQREMGGDEALLSYFAPHGILDMKLGLEPEISIDELHRFQVANRLNIKPELDRLLPYIKEYYKICGEKTIWDFLKEKGYLLS
jgi:hypothetical protein